MEGEAKNLPAGPLTTTDPNLVPPINKDSSTTNLHHSFATSSSWSTSPPQFLRHVQAAFKRHRPLGMMQSNNIRPRRTLVPQRATSKESTPNTGPWFDPRKSQDEILLSQQLRDCISQPKSMVSVIGEIQEDASIAPPSELGSTINSQERSYRPFNAHRDQLRSFSDCRDTVASSVLEAEHVPLVEGQKKVHFEAENNARAQGVDDRIATGTDNLSSHMDSLALTDMEWDMSNQGGVTTSRNQDLKYRTIQSVEVDGSLRSEGGVSSSIVKTIGFSNQLHHFTNFLQNDLSQPMTQSSVVGSSCPTTTLINSTSAPMLSSTTYCSQPQLTSSSHLGVESLVEVEMNSRPKACEDVLQLSDPASKCISGVPTNQVDAAVQTSRSLAGTQLDVLEVDHSKVPQSNALSECNSRKDPSPEENSTKGNTVNKQSQNPSSKVPSSDVKLDTSKLEKQEKAASGKVASTTRKKNYDPDLFFKVNGKLYQRLGKIGSGGSSEVHKVISADCKIYALKKIKLKGRDYATAYGFYQEIEYLNKLKGKNNIIQLIDYEVTDKSLLQEFISGSMSNKDGRVKEDGYIYMVLEYGEIDLAHMLLQKWKELDSPSAIIGENWLRFYWQQILLAVNTIHEERIVHSDLKPANFLLVRGSLKLIDFGIAKAIMSDTTNIQRDSQVGTLSYMSPEAFMCNETDANGNTIKCGRPSDIWSLGCILYQMVYGRTPFSEYKTFWAKFKVITDPNHEITYEPVSNPWLLDIMKRCLAWDRNERWRIPQLLQHPFLVPPVPPQIAIPQEQSLKLLQLIATSCENDQIASTLCSQLQQLLSDPTPSVQSQTSLSRDQLCRLLCKMSNICIQLQEQLATSGRDSTV